MNNLEVIIGIEIHIELNTKTKMFSPAPNNFDAEPNTCVHQIDLGYPGTLPRVNKQAVVSGVKLAKALEMKINSLVQFDRKHYFYMDLPKGYQITQDKDPIGFDGKIPVEVEGEIKKIEIERIHLEEDTARSNHDSNNETKLDFNRAGVPLIEIVSMPVIKSGIEASSYVSAVRDLVIALGISDAKMEEGSLRADINISLKPYGQRELGTKVEIKNINTLSNIRKAIENEIAEQTKMILTGVEIVQATKRFDEATRTNVTMRIKSGAADYRFFPEPDIAPIQLSDKFISDITVGELPWERIKRYKTENITDEYINKLMQDVAKANYFDKIKYKDKQALAKIFFSEIVSLANKNKLEVDELNINLEDISSLMIKMSSGEISGKQVKTIIPKMHEEKISLAEVINKYNLKQISDEKTINEFIEKVINDNQTFINSNKERPERVVKYLLGSIMKISKGQANPIVTSKLLNEKLGR